MDCYVQKRKCGVDFVYRIEALTKPCDNKRYIPTLVYSNKLVQGYTNSIYTRNRCCRYPIAFENCQIFYSGLRKHFLCLLYLLITSIIARANLENISQKTNTYGAKLNKTLLKNNIETKLCYLQIGVMCQIKRSFPSK